MGLFKKKKKTNEFKKTADKEVIDEEDVDEIFQDADELEEIVEKEPEEVSDEEVEEEEDEEEKLAEAQKKLEVAEKKLAKAKAKKADEEEKSEAITRTVVVKELPTQVIRTYVDDNGDEMNLITVEEALTKIMEALE
jgi:hypothetical protein